MIALSGCKSQKTSNFVQGKPPILLSSVDKETMSFSVKINASSEMDKLRVAVWSAVGDAQGNDQDDLHWYDTYYVDDSWNSIVDLQQHHFDNGVYHVHVYDADEFYWDSFLIVHEFAEGLVKHGWTR